jgi:hypothetical protein
VSDVGITDVINRGLTLDTGDPEGGRLAAAPGGGRPQFEAVVEGFFAELLRGPRAIDTFPFNVVLPSTVR